MSLRVFIGIFILLAMLLAASTPALYQPAAVATQDALAKSGIPFVSEVVANDKNRANDQRSEQESDREDARSAGALVAGGELQLKGYRAENGRLQDALPIGSRSATQIQRSLTGTKRALAKGRMLRSAIPKTSDDEIVLDARRCPVLSVEVIAYLLLADEQERARFDAAAAAADDSAACTQALRDQLERLETAGAVLPGDLRREAMVDRQGFASVMISKEFDRRFRELLADPETDLREALDQVQERRR